MTSRIKKLISAASAAVLALAAFPVQIRSAQAASSAEEVIQDGLFVYDKVDGGYAVKECTATIMTEMPGIVNGIPIVEIESRAFYNCGGIDHIDIPQTVKKIGEGAFSFCGGLKEVTIPVSVTEIPDNAFLGCQNLEKVTVADSVARIGDSAFASCTALSEFTLPASLTEMGDGVFSGTPINKFNADNCEAFIYKDYILTDKDETVIYKASNDVSGELRVADGIEKISGGAFTQCYGLEYLYFPASLTEIGDNAFWDCMNVRQINFSEGLTEIGDNAFTYNELVETAEFPISLKTIGDSAFFGCASLSKVILQDGLEDVGESAFYGCGNLKSITVPSSVRNIGGMAFGYTVDLETEKDIKIDGFRISTTSGSAAAKYAKANGIECNASDKNIKAFAFIIIGIALLAAAAVFAAVLMARGRKGAPMSAKKAQKEEKEKEIEESYSKILDDEHPEKKSEKNTSKDE